MAALSLWRTLTRFDQGKIATEIAVRNTAGFTAAFLLGNWFGGPGTGVLAALGALNVAFSDSRDPYAIRARRMLITAGLSAMAVAMGGISGHSGVLAVIAATLWAFGSGMLVALGAAAGDLGVITLVTLVVFAARPLAPLNAVESGLAAMTGGLLQTLLSIALWPVQRYLPERRIVSALYTSLAAIARTSSLPSDAPPLSLEISDAQDRMGGLRQDHGAEAERLVFLVNQAERVRLSVLTLGRLSRRLQRDRAEGCAVSDEIRRVLGDAAKLLENISSCAMAGRQPEGMAPLPMPASLGAQPHHTPFFAALLEDARHQIDALAGQIRSAAGASAPTWKTTTFHPSRSTFIGRATERIAKLRANLSWQSTVFRHAVRLSVCLGLSDALGRGLSLQRAYWIPMTVAIVLKPDFSTTVTRGVLRIAGTFLGLGLATVLFHFMHTGVIADVVLMTLFTFLFRWVGSANYGIFVTALSSMIVLMLAVTGAAPRDVIATRALNTLIGGTLALGAYFVWPTWEKAGVGGVLADMLDAYRLYFRAVMGAFHGEPLAAIDAVRVSGRRARSNAEASVDRVSSEPRVKQARLNALDAVLVNSHSFVHAVMSLESALHRRTRVPFPQGMAEFTAAVEATLSACATALRRNTSLPPRMPNLRVIHNRVTAPDTSGGPNSLVNVETDRIVTSLNTLGETLPKAIPSSS